MGSLTLAGPVGKIHILEHAPADDSTREALPTVLLHGMVGHVGFWDAALAAGANRTRTFAMDLRGHGDSAAPADADYALSACAEDVYAVLDALDLERVALVGHSFGTLVALAVAAGRPDRVARLVLVDPPGDFTQMPDVVRDEQLVPFLAALATDEVAYRRGAGIRGSTCGRHAADPCYCPVTARCHTARSDTRNVR